ncbi:MAG: aminotransferase class V-fold PLP-dependent enzyme [Deltaproteobacteria bacterium]|nr:aminotransferase class V-fold PLP-dependent enzyme [Deltaproteobacteria bacterium]
MFSLDPEVVHLNHGSFGACLRPVQRAQDQRRARLEGATMRYFVREWQGELDAARAAVAAFVRADADGLVFVPNATTGVATVLASLRLAPGDELLATDHTYRACRLALDRVAATAGAKVVIAELPWPAPSAAAVTAAIVGAATPRTKLLLLDHITSATALVLDAAAIIAALAARGIDTLVDGAHAPGQLDLDIGALGAAYYVANGHKWLCGAKGGAFLWAKADRRAGLHPLVTSHGFAPSYGPANRFWAEHDWTGTHDPSPYLVLPEAIAILDTAADGTRGRWAAVRARNHALVTAGRARIADRLGAGAMAPDALHGAMAVIPVQLPAGATGIAVERQLLEAGWEVPVIDGPRGQALVRISAHLYNHLAEYDGLAVALAAAGVTGARGQA